MQSCLIKENNMKATGIIIRMDDLGRIQIPKELRKQVFGLKKVNMESHLSFLLMETVL